MSQASRNLGYVRFTTVEREIGHWENPDPKTVQVILDSEADRW